MNILRKVIFYLVILVSVAIIGVTMLSLLYDVNVWWIKTLDFPRVQCFFILLLCLLGFIFLNRHWSWGTKLLVVGLVSSLGLQAYFIYPYTSLPAKVVPSINSNSASDASTVSLLIANVYMYNRKANAFLDIVQEADPDMVLVMETDQWWMDAIQPLQNQYAYHHEYPTSNTYGMGLYSRFPMLDMQTEFFQHDSVPSFHTQVQLPSGRTFMFHGVHPVPPVHSEHPDNAGEKEIEIIKVGQMITQEQQPAIVAGDFNDVAWSHTSRLFHTEGQLYDTRIGRGLYSSFDATSSIMRWPLDHIYVTKEFKMITLQRLDKFGSDHFPIYGELVLE